MELSDLTIYTPALISTAAGVILFALGYAWGGWAEDVRQARKRLKESEEELAKARARSEAATRAWREWEAKLRRE